MFYIVQFIIVWIVWFIFADKKRWRELFPVSFLAAALGSMADTLASYYGTWTYHGHLTYFTRILDNLGIYLVTPYLFIQCLPTMKTFWALTGYIFVWATSAISIEWLHLKTGHMEHGNGWSSLFSYIADFALLAFFYGYYKLFRFEKLTEETP